MKCPKCGQSLVNNPEVCINCGYMLKQKKEFTLTGWSLLLIMLIFFIAGGGIVLTIMFYGIDRELNKRLEILERTVKNEVSTYYGHYRVTKIITSPQTENKIIVNEEDYLGWPIVLKQEQLKIGFNGGDGVIIENPVFTFINPPSLLLELFPFTEEEEFIFRGRGIPLDQTVSVNFTFLDKNNVLYLFYEDTLFELTPDFTFGQTYNNFYKFSKPLYSYENEIIKKGINAWEENYKSLVMSPTRNIINFYYQVYAYHNFEFLVLRTEVINNDGQYHNNYKAYPYHLETKKLYNLSEFFDEVEETANVRNQIRLVGLNEENITSFYVDHERLYLRVNDEGFEFSFVPWSVVSD